MTVKEFVKKYNSLQNKSVAIKDLKVKSYIPFEQKIDLCQMIIDNTCYRNFNGKKEYFVNSPARYMFFCLALINAYTSINVDYKNGLEDFNQLDENGLIDEIIFHQIPETEYKMMDVIMKMKMEDVYENERSMIAVLSSKLQAAEIFLQELSTQIDISKFMN